MSPTGKGRRLLYAGITFAALAIAVVAYFILQPRHDYAPPPLTFGGSSTALEKTIVVPTLDTPLANGKSAVWCASFQLAWKELVSLAKGPIQLSGPELAWQRLNNCTVTNRDLSPEIYYAAAGLSRDGIEDRIRREMGGRFPHVAVPDLGKDNVAVAFAYLEAAIKFQIPYFDSTMVFKDSNGKETNIQAFGIRHKEAYGMQDLRKQVGVLFAEMGRDVSPFALDLCTTSQPHQIVVAQVPRPVTLAEGVKDVQKRTNQGKRVVHFGPGSCLLVPSMNWKVDHRFRELEGKDKIIEGSSLNGLYISKAFQSIQFKLDKSGAELASTAGLIAKADDPNFIVNNPYLIITTKRGAENPFFVMWVDNAELMVKAEALLN